MRIQHKIDPDFEFNWGPALWAAATTVLIGLVVNFLLFRPSWIIPGALIAGGIAAARSDYYQPSGNSGAVGVAIGTIVVAPFLAFTRAFAFGGGGGDLAFITVVLAFGWLTIVAMVMVPMGYLGALLVDYTRKKVGGPIGY